MEYDDFDVQIGPRSGAAFLVRVLRSPAGEGEGTLHLPEIGRARLLSPAGVGGALYRSLFTGQVGLLFHQSLIRIRGEGPSRGLRIRLRLNPRDPALGALQSAPWELLYREETEDFLALSRLTPVVRAFDLPRPTTLQRLAPPLRILVVLSQDPESEHLELARELDALLKSLRQNPSIQVEVLDSPDTRMLRAALCRRPFHVLHIMGHGAFDPRTGEGVLLFRGSDGGRETISGRHLAVKVKDFTSLRLAVLNACDTALARAEGEHGPFAGVAAALGLGGLPAVVAMQSPIEDAHAIAFSSAFYDRLAHGKPVDDAMTEGRQAIHSLRPTGGDWAAPVLFLRTASADLFAGVAPEASPSQGARERPRRAVARVSAAVFLLLLLAAIGALLRLRTETGPDGSEQPGSILRKAVATQIEPPSPKHSKPATPISSAAAGRRTAPTGQTIRTGGLRFEVSAPEGPSALSKSLERALGRAAQGLPEPFRGSAGWTVHLDLAPSRLSGYDESGIELQSCAVSASLRVLGHGPPVELGPIRTAGSAVDGGAACDEAIEKLAAAVVHKIFQLSKEESR